MHACSAFIEVWSGFCKINMTSSQSTVLSINDMMITNIMISSVIHRCMNLMHHACKNYFD